jgi:hypothetical protein
MVLSSSADVMRDIESEATMNMNRTDLTLFLNQVSLGFVNNEALSQWLADEKPATRGREPVWNEEAMDYWMGKLIYEQSGIIANA